MKFALHSLIGLIDCIAVIDINNIKRIIGSFGTFADESFAYLPGENGRVLPLVLFDLVDHDGSGHFRLGAADHRRVSGRSEEGCGRVGRRCLVITTCCSEQTNIIYVTIVRCLR